MPEQKTSPEERRVRAKDLILSGSTKGEIKLLLAEEFGVTPRTAGTDAEAAAKEYHGEMLVTAEQLRVASAMYMGGFRPSRIADALVDQWGTGGEVELKEPLSEERARRLIEVAQRHVDAESLTSKDEKRAWMGRWFEDKMTGASKERDQLRAAALLMRLEGLADLSEYEAPTDDIVIEIGNWRQGFKQKLEYGEAPSAGNICAPENGAPINGTARLNGNGHASP